MQIRCPNCQEGIELVGDSDFQCVDCPSCGIQFGLVDVAEDNIATLVPGDKVPQGAERTGRAGKGMVAHFELVEEVGRGAFGSVWRALDTELDRTVAVKVPRPGQFSESSREQFLREARAAAQLSHPNIVSIHEVGFIDDRIYIVSDFVDGISLAEFLGKKRLSPRQAASFCIKVAGALEHAHEKGVIHRDLKPGNIMLARDGQPQVMDFGLAKREAGEVTMTVEGKLLGTPAYMPPEQARGEGHDVDRRADVYSLGVILYELLTGELPFRGTTRMLLHQVMHDEAPSLRKLNNSIPRDIETITLKCLEKDPDKRYEGCGEMIADLQAWVDHRPIKARPVGQLGKLLRWRKRKPAVAALSVAMILILLAGTAVSTYFAIDASREAIIARNNEEATRQAMETAETERKEAERQAGLAREAEGESRRYAYNSDVASGFRSLGEGNVRPINKLFDRYQEDPDFHAFEWFYLKGLRDRGNRAVVRGGRGVSWGTLGETEGLRLTIARFHPVENKILVGGIYPKHLAVMDIDTGQMEREFLNETFKMAAEFSPDGKYVVGAYSDGEIKMWEFETGNLSFTRNPSKLLYPDRKIPTPVEKIAFNPDQTQLAVSTASHDCLIYELSGDAFLPTLKTHFKGMVPTYSRDGALMANGSPSEMVIQIRDGNTWEIRDTWELESFVRSLIFSSGMNRLASITSDGSAKIWDVDSGEELFDLKKIAGAGASSINFSPDGKLVATGGNDNIIRIWDAGAGREMQQKRGHLSNVDNVAFNPSGEKILSTSVGGQVVLWEVNRQRKYVELPSGNRQCHAVTFSPDGKYLATAAGRIRLWNANKKEELMTLKVTGSTVHGLCFSPDSRRLIVGQSIKEILSYNLAEETWSTYEGPGYASYFAFSPDGKHLAVSAAHGHQGAMVLDLANGTTLPQEESFKPIGFLNESDVIWTNRTQVISRDYRSNQGQDVLFPINNNLTAGATNADRSLIARGTNRGEMVVWDVIEKRQSYTANWHTDPIITILFSQDGKRIVSADSTTIVVGDAQTGRQLLRLAKNAGTIRSIAISPDGLQIVAGGDAGLLRVWDARPLEEEQSE